MNALEVLAWAGFLAFMVAFVGFIIALIWAYGHARIKYAKYDQ